MSGSRTPCAALLALIFHALLCHPAWADQDFQTHYQLGAALYQAQRYDEAIVEFQAAYRVESKPGLLFNIAQAYRKSGHPREAIEYYDRYLQATPQLDGDTRKKVDGYLIEARNTLAALELELKRRMAEDKATHEKEGKATPPEQEPEPPGKAAHQNDASTLAVVATPAAAPVQAQSQPINPPIHKPLYKRWWFWAAIGGAVVAGAVGAVVGTQVHTGPQVPDVSRGTVIF